jgi:cellulose synthase/poly-beta-1,6-N-acetylglucosamine synthase-like glycosyltransferase
LKALIGIPAYNEEKNIRRLLESLSKACSKIEDECTILVISSGSTDQTDMIVRDYMKSDTDVKLVTEEERKGKVSAINLLLDEAQDYDVMICMGADNLPDDDAVGRLCEAFRDPNVGIVGAHPVPVDDPNSFWGWISHTLWNIHHLVSLEHPKTSGELFAIRSNIVKELPPGIINDDMYLQALVEQKGHKAVYLSDVHVSLKGPSGLRDFIRQRRRVIFGHIQLEFLMGTEIPTMNTLRNLSLLRKAKPKASFMVGLLRSFVFLASYLIAQILVEFDFLMKKPPYMWEIAKTTKTLR